MISSSPAQNHQRLRCPEGCQTLAQVYLKPWSLSPAQDSSGEEDHWRRAGRSFSRSQALHDIAVCHRRAQSARYESCRADKIVRQRWRT